MSEKDLFSYKMLKQIGNVEISPSILGDSAYSLENWLMKPYSDSGNLSPNKARFNLALSRSRVVVENAFGRLKARLQCISKTLDTTLEHTKNFSRHVASYTIFA